MKFKFRIQKYADCVAESCLLSVHDLKVKDGITYLPIYMTSLLPGMAAASICKPRVVKCREVRGYAGNARATAMRET